MDAPGRLNFSPPPLFTRIGNYDARNGKRDASKIDSRISTIYRLWIIRLNRLTPYGPEGGKERVYITGGTLHENSGYAKRFFSLKTSPYYPCVVLHSDRHEMVPFKTVEQALKYLR